jgi:hypothetical protein
MTTYNLSTEELNNELALVRDNILSTKRTLLALEAKLYELDDKRNALVNKLESNQSPFIKTFEQYSKSQDEIRQQSAYDQKLYAVINALAELTGGV